MAALALIAERPKILEHILLIKTINKQGIYLVRLCYNGLWTTAIIDDYFPYTQCKQLAYTQANHYQLYVPLIEKACAKLFGSYADLINGQTEEGLLLLTGAPCEEIYLNADDDNLDTDIIPFSMSFWDEKNSHSERDYTVIIYSKIQIDVEVINKLPTFLADCLIAYCVKEYSRISKHKYFNYYATSGKSDLIIFLAENRSLTNYLNINIDMSNGICIRNSRQSLITHDCIPPYHRQIIFFAEWTDEQNQKAQMNYVYNFSYVNRSNNSVPVIRILQKDFHSFRSFNFLEE